MSAELLSVTADSAADSGSVLQFGTINLGAVWSLSRR